MSSVPSAARSLPDRERAALLRADVERIRDDARRLLLDASRCFATSCPAGTRRKAAAGLTAQIRRSAWPTTAWRWSRRSRPSRLTWHWPRTCPRTSSRSARRAATLRDETGFLMRADDPGFVFFVETRGRGVFLRAAPIDVSSIVRELLLDRMDATILTSATLSVDGGFDYVRSRLGIKTRDAR